MSQTINGEFHLEETWVIQGSVRDYQGQPIDLLNSNVRFRFATSKGDLVLDLATPADGTVTNVAAGEYEFLITAAQQETANVSPGSYKYEVKADLSNGRSTIQNKGTITVLPSLFANA